MDFQKMFDMMSAQARQTRSLYHVTLGALIDALKDVDLDMQVLVRSKDGVDTFPGRFSSYRGYYADLSLSEGSEPMTVDTLLSQAEVALGSTFEGYKGGDFVMGHDTPLWFAEYGCCGPAIIDAYAGDGFFLLITKDLD